MSPLAAASRSAFTAVLLAAVFILLAIRRFFSCFALFSDDL
jgi:hypothetical protein